mgnify:CR=1 FL=1
MSLKVCSLKIKGMYVYTSIGYREIGTVALVPVYRKELLRICQVGFWL